MSDSGGFLDNLKSKLTDAINKITGMAGSAADTSEEPAPDPTPPTEPSVIDKYLSYIPADVLNYLTWAIKIIIPLLFATIVANEMIIYKPSVRLFYFILTWILCFVFTSFRWIIVIYYLLRLAFNRYRKGEGLSGGFFPTIYALLPWSTDIDTIRPLRYLTLDIGDMSIEQAFEDKSFQKKIKNVYYLGEKMVDYFNVLESANPYRGYGEIYDENFATVKKSLFEMHMPALEIDHKQKQYIIELRRSKDEDDKEDNEDGNADGNTDGNADGNANKNAGNNDEKGDKAKKNNDIVEYIQIGEHSMKPSVPPKAPLKDRKNPLYAVSYNKYTDAFTLQKNEASQKDAEKMKLKEEAKAEKEAEEQRKKAAESGRNNSSNGVEMANLSAKATVPPPKPVPRPSSSSSSSSNNNNNNSERKGLISGQRTSVNYISESNE